MSVGAANEKDPLIGRVVGGCRLQKRLGQGGMGTVYLCDQLSLDRPVVLKILHGELLTRPEFIKRFQREARAAARLFHPNVVQVIDCGQEGHLYYIVMEYVDGVTVKDMIEARGAIALDRTIKIVTETAEGLAAVHDAGFIHRDVKPANIMLNSKGVVKIADFGIAKPTDPAQEEEITQTNFLVGTVQYMSPEQCDGQEIDLRADIYSLGVTFYQMLTGRRPFEGRSTVDLMRQHIHEPPPPIERFVRGVPSDVANVLARMMAKEPEDRYRDGHALIADLKSFASRRETESLTPTREIDTSMGGPTRVRLAPPRRRGSGGVLLVLFLFAVAGGAYGWWKLGGPVPGPLADLLGLGRPADPGPDPGPVADSPPAEILAAIRADLAAGALGAARSRIDRARQKGEAGDWRPIAAEVDRAIGEGMVEVPAGPFPFGPDDRQRTLPAYWIDRHEVSNAAYARFVRATGAEPPVAWEGPTVPPGREGHPVGGVALAEARAYAAWAGKRIPTEAEWEKAARGPGGDPFPWGKSFDDDRANTMPSEGTVAVDSLPAGRSPVGCEQMIGNVWEWTEDGGGVAGVLKGGGFSSVGGSTEFHPSARTRVTMRSDSRSIAVGFRCAWDGPAR